MEGIVATEEQVKEIQRMWLDGCKKKEIAKTLGVSMYAIEKHTIKVGLGRRMTQEKIEKMQEMWRNGYSQKQIMGYFNVTSRTVYNYTTKAGIEREKEVIRQNMVKNTKKEQMMKEWDNVCNALKRARRKKVNKPTGTRGKTFS